MEERGGKKSRKDKDKVRKGRKRIRRKGKSKMVTSFQKLVSRTKEKQLGESSH